MATDLVAERRAPHLVWSAPEWGVGITDDPPSFRFFRPGDEDAIARVYAASFDRWPPFSIPVSPQEFLRWFVEPHETFQGRTMVGTVGGQVVTANCAIVRPILVHGIERLGVVGGLGSAVDPRFRRRGIYAAGRQWRIPRLGVEMHLRFTQTEAHRRVQRRTGRTSSPIANRLSLFLRVLRPWRAASGQSHSRLRGAGYAALKVRSTLRSRTASRPDGVEIRRLAKFDDRVFSRFWSTAAAAWDLIPVRTAEFLNWRWLDPRTGPFTVLAATHGEELLGYIVLRADAARGHISDILVLPGRGDVMRALIDAGVRALNEAGVGAIECWMMERHPYTEALRHAGFVRLRRRSNELTRKLQIESRHDPEELRFLVEPGAAVHVVEGDSDLI